MATANDELLREEHTLEVGRERPKERRSQQDASDHLADHLGLAQPTANHPYQTAGGENHRELQEQTQKQISVRHGRLHEVAAS